MGVRSIHSPEEGILAQDVATNYLSNYTNFVQAIEFITDLKPEQGRWANDSDVSFRI